MTRLMTIHLAGGSHALLSGTTAVAARKGGALHARAGACFVLSMLVLGLTATVLARGSRRDAATGPPVSSKSSPARSRLVRAP